MVVRVGDTLGLIQQGFLPQAFGLSPFQERPLYTYQGDMFNVFVAEH